MHGHGRTVQPRLHYLKCIQCWKDKKRVRNDTSSKSFPCTDYYVDEVLALDRTWPRQKCERCEKYNYACSASMTAKQEREASNPPPRASEHQTWDTSPATEGTEKPRDEPSGQPDNSPPCKPKRGPYFSTLTKARWNTFGTPSSESGNPTGLNSLDSMFSFLTAYEAKHVHDRVMSRFGLVYLGQVFTKMVQDGMSKGMTVKNAREFASRKVIFTAGKQREFGGQNEEFYWDEIIHDFDDTISLALGWQALLDTICAPEVLLIDFDDTSDWEDDIPIPRIGLKNDKSTCPLPELLAPRLVLKEACLRLSGVLDMIRRLKGLEQPELRTFLAGEIRKRV